MGSKQSGKQGKAGSVKSHAEDNAAKAGAGQGHWGK